MARKRKYRTRYRTKKVYRRARTSGGKYKDVIDGVLAGAGSILIKKYINIPFADDLALLGVGYFRRNPTLKVLGGVGIAGDLLGMVGMNNTNKGGYIA